MCQFNRSVARGLHSSDRLRILVIPTPVIWVRPKFVRWLGTEQSYHVQNTKKLACRRRQYDASSLGWKMKQIDKLVRS